jgi:DNA-directed RNA polymerase subunit RPC12/RpoP
MSSKYAKYECSDCGSVVTIMNESTHEFPKKLQCQSCGHILTYVEDMDATTCEYMISDYTEADIHELVLSVVKMHHVTDEVERRSCFNKIYADITKTIKDAVTVLKVPQYGF